MQPDDAVGTGGAIPAMSGGEFTTGTGPPTQSPMPSPIMYIATTRTERQHRMMMPFGPTAIARTALSDFKAMLLRLAVEGANNFSMVDTQGVLAPAD